MFTRDLWLVLPFACVPPTTFFLSTPMTFPSSRSSSQGGPAESASVLDSGSERRSFGSEGVPLAVILALGVVLATIEGGFADSHRYAASLFVLAVFVVLVATRGVSAIRTGSRPLKVAVGALLGFLVWSYLSIIWSDAQAVAFSGANRTALYVLVFLIMVLSRVSVQVASHILLVFVMAVAVLTVTTSIQLTRALDPLEFVIGNRLSAPIGYPNGTAVLLMIAAWTAFGLATRAWLNVVARSVAFGATGALGLLALLSQSRGSVFTTPLVALTFLLLVPGRWRSILSAGLIAIVCGLAAPSVLSVLPSTSTAELTTRVEESVVVVVAAFCVLALVGAVFVIVDRRVTVSRSVTLAASVALVAVVIGVALVGGSRVGVVDRADALWADFTRNSVVNNDSSTRFGGLGSNRYDFWRVGLHEFAANPIGGIGVDNFLVPYLQERRSSEEPIYPHSSIVGLLSQTGIVGTALFAVWIAAALWSLLSRPQGPARELAAVVMVGASALLFHSLVDWLWEIPAVGLIGFALLGLAFAVQPEAVSLETHPPMKHRKAARVGFVVGVSLVAVTLGSAWLSARYVDSATSTVGLGATAAIAQLDTASRLNPFAEEPALLAAAIANDTGDLDLARRRLDTAVSRNPSNWYAQLQLGAVAAAQGDNDVAEAALERARELNPSEPVVCLAFRRFSAGSPLAPKEVERALSLDLPAQSCRNASLG